MGSINEVKTLQQLVLLSEMRNTDIYQYFCNMQFLIIIAYTREKFVLIQWEAWFPLAYGVGRVGSTQ
jgi:hypothetical protein